MSLKNNYAIVAAVSCEMAVEVVWDDRGKGVSLPIFRPINSHHNEVRK